MTHPIPSLPYIPFLLDLADEEGADSTKAAATITGAILGFKVLGPIGALAGATFANHYGERREIGVCASSNAQLSICSSRTYVVFQVKK
jgi:hypothetical protein